MISVDYSKTASVIAHFQSKFLSCEPLEIHYGTEKSTSTWNAHSNVSCDILPKGQMYSSNLATKCSKDSKANPGQVPYSRAIAVFF